jgi:hypothetical protein
VFFVADTEAVGPMVANELNVYLWKDGFHLFFPMRGKDRWRVIGILPRRLRDRDGLTFDEVVPAITQEAGTRLSFRSCSWFSTYRIQHRCVERFRDRRCFLLGDAAHVHSPMGGQGMNTGLQDAYNLAWKLALVVQGQAGASLLDTYEAERLPVAQQLLQTTDRAFTLVVSESWVASLFRTRLLAKIAALAMKRERVRISAFRALSQIGIRYSHSSLSRALAKAPEGAPHAGDRLPWMRLRFEAGGGREDVFDRLDDTRFNLIVIGQPAPAETIQVAGTPLRTHAVSDDAENAQELARNRVPSQAFYLVRPDGHIGLAGSRLEADTVRRYLSEIGIGAQRP